MAVDPTAVGLLLAGMVVAYLCPKQTASLCRKLLNPYSLLAIVILVFVQRIWPAQALWVWQLLTSPVVLAMAVGAAAVAWQYQSKQSKPSTEGLVLNELQLQQVQRLRQAFVEQQEHTARAQTAHMRAAQQLQEQQQRDAKLRYLEAKAASLGMAHITQSHKLSDGKTASDAEQHSSRKEAVVRQQRQLEEAARSRTQVTAAKKAEQQQAVHEGAAAAATEEQWTAEQREASMALLRQRFVEQKERELQDAARQQALSST